MASSPPPRLLSAPLLGLAAGLAAYAVLLYILIGAVPGGSDNSGYFNEARLFARGRVHTPMRTLAAIPPADVPYLYVPLGFKPSSGDASQLVPTYPPGLPLLLVPAARVIGWQHAGDFLLLVHSLAGIALTFALGRLCGLPGPWSLVAAAILAASPIYLITSLQALRDVPATVWATAAIAAALKSRDRSGWALASGACITVGFLIRPSNFLVALPVLIAAGLSPRRLLLVALGSMPGIAAWMAINHVAYGDALQSGYGALGGEFHSDLVAGTLAFYARWLPLLLSPVVAFAPLILAPSRTPARVAAVLLSWAAAFLAFYSAYRWTHEQWWFLRFVLPAAPALIVGGLAALWHWLSRGVAGRSPAWAVLLPALVLAAAVGVEVSQTRPLREAWAIGHGERKYGRVSRWLESHVPGDSVLMVSQASGALYYFTGFTLLRHDQITPPVAARIRASVQSEKLALYAVLFPFELDALKRLPCAWTKVGAIDDVSVWRCDWESQGKSGR